jgi:hypothetical protein
METPHISDRTLEDSAFTPFVTASADEIRYAQQLRTQIEQQYLNRPTPPVSFWSVGAD